MKVFRNLVLAIALLVVGLVPASAATCFWVGGTGTWDNSTDAAHWSSSTGGSGSTCAATGGVPKNAGDVATFDGASGGGTVTTNTSPSIASIVMGAFTGTLDFSVNNNSATLTTTFNVSGTGTRALKLGSGTFTLTGTNVNNWDATTTTGLTLTAGTSTILITTPGNGNGQSFVGGSGQTYATVSIGSRTNLSIVSFTTSSTLGTLLVAAPSRVSFNGGVTTTVTNAISWAGTSTNQISVENGGSSVPATLAVAVGSSITWAAIRGITFTGTTVPATNSFDLQGNTGVTITAPSGGGGGRIIGG